MHSDTVRALSSDALAERPITLVWYGTGDLRIADHQPLLSALARGAVVPAFVWQPQREGAIRGAAQAWLRSALLSLGDDLRALGSDLVLRATHDEAVLADEARDEHQQLGDDEHPIHTHQPIGTHQPRVNAPRVNAPRVNAPPANAPRVNAPPVNAPRVNAPPVNALAPSPEDTLVSSALLRLVRESGATACYYHRSYEPERTRLEEHVSRTLQLAGCEVRAFGGRLLYEPHLVQLADGFHGGHWGTLMPFLKACERAGPPPATPAPAPSSLPAPKRWPRSEALSALQLAPLPLRAAGGSGRDWATALLSHWSVSEGCAQSLLAEWVEGDGLASYESRRSRADLTDSVSRLSPYLRFGQLSPRHVYHAVRSAGVSAVECKTFRRRLHWRDLAYYQLDAFPTMDRVPIRAHYASQRWSDDHLALRMWQLGRTGYPMVDAGMRELYATGWMHQSVRMICASFLVEYLNLNWVHGHDWFAHTLVDADVAINAMMWQNAGRSGIDQWNFVSSPESGSQDPTGAYCRRWIPELKQLPRKYLHTPWQAPAQVLAASGIRLGETYPERIVSDLKAARADAVAAVVEMRRRSLQVNDAGGYDTVTLPNGIQTRVFTKQEFRLNRDGTRKEFEATSSMRGRGRGRAIHAVPSPATSSATIRRARRPQMVSAAESGMQQKSLRSFFVSAAER